MKSLEKQAQAIVEKAQQKAQQRELPKPSVQTSLNSVVDGHEETEVVVVQPYRRGEHISPGAPKWQVEMMLSQALVECKRAVDVYVGHMHKQDMKRIDVWRNVFIICCQEALMVIDNLKGMNDASLCLKHRLARRLWKQFRDDLEVLYPGMMEAKNQNKSEAKTFGTLVTQFLTDIHLIMHENTPRAEKIKITNEATAITI